MDELLAQLKYHLHGIIRFKWHAVVSAWVVVVLGIPMIYLLPDEYEAHARVYIDSQSILKPLLKGIAVETDVVTEINMMARAILGNAQLERVIRKTDLSLRAADEKSVQKMVRQLRGKIEIKSSGGTGRTPDDMYKISYKDSDPKLAARVVDTLLDTLVESSLGSKRRDAVNAEKFLVRQIEEYEKRLSKAEARLARFKQNNIGLMPSDGQDYYARLQNAMDQLKETRVALRIAQDRRRELGKRVAGKMADDSLAGGHAWTAGIDKEIAERRAELNAKLLIYTEQHPDVVALNEIIEQLNVRKREQLASLEKTGGASNLPDNPVYQSMKIAINDVEVDISTLRAKELELSEQIKELQKHVDTMPQIEARLADLNRDYAVTKQQYESLLQRLEAARLSQGAEGTAYSLRIIDPPSVPLNPEGPNRFLYLLLLPFVGVGVGLAVSLGMHQIQPAFGDRDELREAVGLPVLGCVSAIMDDSTKRAETVEMRRYALAIALLVVTVLMSIWFTGAGARAYEESKVEARK